MSIDQSLKHDLILAENCSKVDQVLGWIAEYRPGVHAVLIDKIEPADEKHCHPRFFCPNMSDKIQQKTV